ncbi:MAG: aspartate ammonia-lyase [Alphaproteobacteria bacterium]|nr:aspartate ammonia-lyase [Alphaproteobacteria bacterium]
MMRTETDALGSLSLDALWGIHTQRALNNFPLSHRPVPYPLIAAIATVKQAAAQTNKEQGHLSPDIADAIIAACQKICSDEKTYASAFPLDALQGGAGTSTNMNVNEVVANLALQTLGHPAGSYDIINPIDHVNRHQSTNDVYPTALRVAAIGGLRSLSDALAKLQGALQDKEKEFHDILKMGRTELQAAVPMTLGQEFSAFSEAISRDRWRTFKCEERLRMVNIGGTAIGTGLTAPRDYIFRVIEVLRGLTGMGLARSENVIDGNANADVFVEVSGILKASAANLAKIAGDLRLLHFLGEITLPPLQVGSSIMPGKINPVLVESVLQVSLTVRAKDMIIAECAAHGTLQINEFLPLIATALLESIELLKTTSLALAKHIEGIVPHPDRCRAFVEDSPTLLTALLPLIGYEKARSLMKEFEAAQQTSQPPHLKDFLTENLGPDFVEKLLSDTNFIQLGYKP